MGPRARVHCRNYSQFAGDNASLVQGLPRSFLLQKKSCEGRREYSYVITVMRMHSAARCEFLKVAKNQALRCTRAQ